MAVGLTVLKDYFPVPGVRIGVAKAGIKYENRKDLVIFELVEGSRVSGVFTTNAFCAAPVQVARKHLESGSVRYLIINTGNANAGTGKQGSEDASETCSLVAAETGVAAEQVLPFSTGVIGEPLPMPVIKKGIPEALAHFSDADWADAAEGIMTTDTLPKGYSGKFDVEGTEVTVTGVSKGAGMIMPNMATMLAFVTTDAVVAQPLLDRICKSLADKSFNRVTVDGDTSTNDACMLVATGQANMVEISDESDSGYQALYDGLLDAFMKLSHAIVRDGEGATKFVSVTTAKAASSEEALQVSYTVAHSPLVKTALFASDANWGRILAAVGRSGVKDFDLSEVDIYLDDVCIVSGGGRSASYTEEAGSRVFEKSEFEIRIVLGRGDAQETVWTTDFSHDYVTINAEYRT